MEKRRKENDEEKYLQIEYQRKKELMLQKMKQIKQQQHRLEREKEIESNEVSMKEEKKRNTEEEIRKREVSRQQEAVETEIWMDLIKKKREAQEKK
jgi:hypothetical protein